MIVPLSEPDITQVEIDAVISVLRSARLSLGPKLEEFEESFTQYTGVEYAVAVSSGTAALHLCIRAMGIGAGDEVIVPSFAFIAVANAVRYEGAVPVFVDIERDTLNLDPACIEAAITSRTRAIVAVHTFGFPAQMDLIVRIARRNDLYVIEDACEAIGAEYGGRPAGSWGDAAVFGFYPNKQITTGEGGLIVTPDASLAADMRAMRNQGRRASEDWHQHSCLGFNYRLSEISCTLGCAQMQRIEAILHKREGVAELYRKHLNGVEELRLPQHVLPHGRISWFVYVCRFRGDREPAFRDRVLSTLGVQGVQCGRYFAPIHEQEAYSGWGNAQPLFVTESESRRTIALPFFSNMSEEQVAYVTESLRTAISGCV